MGRPIIWCLALPIATVVTALSLLMSTIFLSSHYGTPVWKSGQLALLLALSPDAEDNLGELGTNKNMDE